jgi:hypothetical protein
LNEKLDLIAEGFGLNREQRRLLLRILWVIGVSTHIAWVCGFLAWTGLAPPFAKAERVERLERSALISARISLQQEYRVQVRAYCAMDESARDGVLRTIDRIRTDFVIVTEGKEYLPEPRCEK